MRARRSYVHLLVLAVIVACTLALGAPVAGAATTSVVISPITRVPGSDAPTSVGLAWHTQRTASASTPQPQTALAFGPAATFDCATQTYAAATKPTTTVYDRVSYAQVTLNSLTPATSYTYCVVAATGERSAAVTFTTPPASGDLTFLAFGNANWRSTTSYRNYYADTVAAARAAYPGAVLATHSGATGSANDLTHWDGFLGSAQSALDALTWVPTSQATGSGNRFFGLGDALPLAANGTDSTNYATRSGNVLLLTLNSRLTSTADATATAAWVTAQVAALGAARASTWVIVSMPTEFYGDTNTTRAYRTTVQRAFADNGVALVVQGGAEAYTRSWPIARDAAGTVQRRYPARSTVATADGIVYLTPGASGVEQAAVPAGATSATSGWLAAATPALTSAQRTAAEEKSYSAITVTADALQVTARTAGGATLDSFTIDRGPTPVGELSPYGLNNGFGQDPATQRVVTWLARTTDGFQTPWLIYRIPGGVEQTSTDCTTTALRGGLAAYTAYTCQVQGLRSGMQYAYRLAARRDGLPYISAAYAFTTAAADNAAFTFLDFADTQSNTGAYDSYWGNNLRTALAAHPEAAFIAQNGDMTDDPSAAQATAWLDAVGTNLSSLAFNPVAGNHDEMGGSAQAAELSGLFSRPSLTAVPNYGEAAPLQYSYVYGNALFLMVNTNMDTTAQLAKTATWVRDTVAAYGKNADGSDKFVIVIEHKSPFGGQHAGSGKYPTGDFSNPNIVAALPKVYAETGVDLVLAGHDHNLIRSKPITWDSLTNKATWNSSAPVVSPQPSASAPVIDSATDGLVYFVPRDAGQKTYAPLSPTPSASSRPWIAYNWYVNERDNGQEAPANDMYATVSVSADAIHVAAYRVGDAVTPVDQFTITQ